MSSSDQLKVLVSAPYMQDEVLDRFRPFFESQGLEIVVPPVFERLEEKELLEWATDVDGVICGDDHFTPTVVSAVTPRLKVISKWGTGIDSIDQVACQEAGIAVCNTPNAFSQPVADSVFGYMLSFARQIPKTSEQMRQGIWEKIPGRSLGECTLGVIGVGNVGSAVVKRACGFGMTILAHDPKEPDATFLAETGITMVTLDELLAQSDFVTTNCDLNPTSHHLMNAEAFEKMKSTAVFINTARGKIVDEPALVHALESGTIAGAGLDVFEHEPLPADSPLRGMQNVLLASHNSNSSPLAWEKVHLNTINNLIRVFTKSFPDRTFQEIQRDTCPPPTTTSLANRSSGKRVVLITGSAGGIGSATARVFAHAGWYVIGVDCRLAKEVSWIDHFIQADVSSPDVGKKIIDEITDKFGRLHALVNNAATQVCSPAHETSTEDWDNIMNTNVRAGFLTAKAAFPLLCQTKGSIINISSVHAIGTSRDICAYATSKGAVLAMTRAMALDFGPTHGIRVNAVLPGAVDTTMLRSGVNRGHLPQSDENAKIRALGKKHVLNRVGKPEEIGQAILFLADETRSSFITGQSMVVDGGATARLSTE